MKAGERGKSQKVDMKPPTYLVRQSSSCVCRCTYSSNSLVNLIPFLRNFAGISGATDRNTHVRCTSISIFNCLLFTLLFTEQAHHFITCGSACCVHRCSSSWIVVLMVTFYHGERLQASTGPTGLKYRAGFLFMVKQYQISDN